MEEKRLERISDNQIILKEGDPCSKIYKILSGEVAIYSKYGCDEEFLHGVLSKGKYIGLESFFTDKLNDYSFVTVGECLVMRVNLDEFEEFVRTNTANAIEIMKVLAESNNRLNTHLNMINEELLGKIKDNKGKVIDLRKKLLESKYKLY